MAETNAMEERKVELINIAQSDDHCRTFLIRNEDHTLGNSLKHIITKYPEVEFCAYNTPHPLEDMILFHIQTRPTCSKTPVDILRRGLQELDTIFKALQTKFEEAVATSQTS